MIDPPFRWFAPRDMLERAITDENHDALRRFLAGVRGRLRPEGPVLSFFGTRSDVACVDALTGEAGLTATVVAERAIPVGDEETPYFVRRLTGGCRRPSGRAGEAARSAGWESGGDRQLG